MHCWLLCKKNVYNSSSLTVASVYPVGRKTWRGVHVCTFMFLFECFQTLAHKCTFRKRPRVRNQVLQRRYWLTIDDSLRRWGHRRRRQATGDSDKSHQHWLDISWYDRTTPATLFPRIFLIPELVCCLYISKLKCFLLIVKLKAV